jgi:hypothetical protein
MPTMGRYCCGCWGYHIEHTELTLIPKALEGPFYSAMKSHSHLTYLSRCQVSTRSMSPVSTGLMSPLSQPGDYCCCSLPAVRTIGKSSFAVKYNQH